MSNKVGISLIVLVITIVVIIILTSAIVLNLSSSNPITKANEAVLKSNVRNIQDELGLYISSHINLDGSYTYPQRGDITLASKYSADILNFVKDKVVYRTSDINEKTQLESMGVIVDYTDGLVANYKMNGINVINSVTNVASTKLGTTPAMDRLGKVDGACLFDGIDDRINTPILNHNIGTGDFTWAIWYKANALSGSPTGATLICNGNFAPWFGVNVTTGKINLWWGGNNLFTNSISTGIWNHLVLRRSSGTISLFVNGVIDSTTFINNTSIANDEIVLGSSQRTNQFDNTNGVIDDVRIYNRALTSVEVKSLYDVYWGD